MSTPRSLLKLLLISFFAFLVVACKPIASFSVSPDPVKVGVEATFDASSTVIYNKPKDNAAQSYAWDFGDGSTSEGKVATHTYATAGTFEVKLTVIDTAGRTGTTTENLVVAAGDVVTDPTTTALKVAVQIAGGVSLSGAEVSVDTVTATSDANGLATLDAAPVGEDQVVTVKKNGYVTQSIRATLTAGDDPQQLLVLLMPEKDTLSIANIAEAQVIASNYLGASVTLPANALVDAATGAAATGAATLKLTPWDISSIDLQAMPGNGRALDASGALVDLISAGMMTVDFFDAAGNKLQLAADKSAVIQMDLPQGTTSIGDNAIAEGSEIPLWHFDETQGLWVEEGTGTVVSNATGLAVQAAVSHFSSWNWAYSFRIAGSVTVQCESPTGSLMSCNVVANVTLPFGSFFTRSATLSPATTTIVNMPFSASVRWKASNASGLIGTATSSSNGDKVIIVLAPPTTSNFVQCKLPNGASTACDLTLSASLMDGSEPTLDYKIPAEGALVETSWEGATTLSWTGKSKFAEVTTGNWSIFDGVVSTAATGPAIVFLSNETPIGSSIPVTLSCDPSAEISQSGARVPLVDCSINIWILDSVTQQRLATYRISDGLSGKVKVYLPILSPQTRVAVYATTTDFQSTVLFGPDISGPLESLANQDLLIKVLVTLYEPPQPT